MDEFTQDSSLSGLTSLESGTDDFGQFMIRQARDEKRLRSAISSNVQLQPFRKARKQQSLALTFKNLERSEPRILHEPGYGPHKDFGSPASLSGSDISDPPFRLPQTWGRKGRPNKDWMRGIVSPQGPAQEQRKTMKDHNGLVSEDQLRRSTGNDDIGLFSPKPSSPAYKRMSMPNTLRSTSQSPRSFSPTPRSYSPVARLESPTARSASPIPRARTPTSKIPQPMSSPSTPPRSSSRIPRLARQYSALREIAALEMESDLSLNSVITSTPAPSAYVAQSTRRTGGGQQDDEDMCSSLVSTILGAEQDDDSDPTRDTLRALSRVLAPKSSPSSSEEREKSLSPPQMQSNTLTTTTNNTEDKQEDKLGDKPAGKLQTKQQDSLAPRSVPEPSVETKAVLFTRSQSPTRKTIPALERPRRDTVPHYSRSPTHFALSAKTDNSGRPRSAGTIEIKQERKANEKTATKSPTKPQPIVTRPTLHKSALEALLSRAKSANETLEPLGESTIDSLEDMFTKDLTHFQEPDDDTLAGMKAPTLPPRNDNERKRNQEVEQLSSMRTRLRTACANVQDTNKGLLRIEQQVDSGHTTSTDSKYPTFSSASTVVTADGTIHRCANTTEILYINPFLLLWAAWLRLYMFVDENNRWRVTWFGMVNILFWSWFITEWSLCNSFCRPRYASMMVGYGIDLYAPQFPFVLPTLFWRMLGFGPAANEGKY